MAFGCVLLLAIFGTGIAIPTDQAQSTHTSEMKKYGCRFKNIEYEYDAPSDLEVAFGTEEIQEMKFDDMDQYNEFLTKVEEVNAKVIANRRFNTMNPYLEFYKAYKVAKETAQSSGEQVDFKKFYRGYRVKFEATSDAAGFNLALLDEIVKVEPRAEKSCYLVVVAEDVDENESNDYPHDNVAGVVKVIIGGRLGYMLLDAGEGMQPKTLMADGQELPTAAKGKVAAEDSSRLVEFEFSMMANGQFIKATHSSYLFHGNSKMSNVYNVSKPFCSVMDSAMKQQLLRNTPTILVRDGSSKMDAFLRAELKAQNLKSEALIFGNREDGGEVVVSKMNLDPSNKSYDEYLLDLVCSSLQVDKDRVLQYRTELYEINQDKTFLQHCHEQYAYLRGTAMLPEKDD